MVRLVVSLRPVVYQARPGQQQEQPPLWGILFLLVP